MNIIKIYFERNGDNGYIRIIFLVINKDILYWSIINLLILVFKTKLKTYRLNVDIDETNIREDELVI